MSSPAPFFSVIVCAHNEAARIGRALESLAVQQYPADRFELVVIDDGSTDGTDRIIREFLAAHPAPPVCVCERHAHGGLACARNAGILAARGDCVAFMDADAEADPAWLAALARTFEAPAVGLTGGRIDLLNPESAVARLVHHLRHVQVFAGESLQNEFIGCNMAMRRAVARRGFFENFAARGDENAFRLAAEAAGAGYAPTPDAVVHHARPTRLRDWLRTEWREKTLWPLALRAAAAPRRNRREWLRMAKLAAYGLLPVAAVTAIAVPALRPGTVLLAAVWVLDQYGRSRNRPWRRAVVGHFGWWRGLLLWGLYREGDALFSLFGFLTGAWRYRHTVLVPAFTSPAQALARNTNSR